MRYHFLRANYQVGVWRSSLVDIPGVPSPNGYGWSINENDAMISVTWNDLKPVPEEVLSLMSCDCSRKCSRNSCICLDNGFNRTYVSKLGLCENMLEEYDNVNAIDGSLDVSDSDYEEDFM